MTLVITQSDVVRVIEGTERAVLDEMIEMNRAGYLELARGVANAHPRIYLRQPEAGVRRPPGLFTMGALLPQSGVMGSRLLAITKQGKGGAGLLVLFDYEESTCLAIVDDSVLHNYRTGAPAALATQLLADPASTTIACLGSSGIARGGVAMTARVLPKLERVRVFSPTEANRRRFAEEMTEEIGVEVVPVDSGDEAADGADVIITATDADRPVVGDAAIKAGAHLNLLARNEIEMATFRRSWIVPGWGEAATTLDPPWREPIPDEWIDLDLAGLVDGGAERRPADRECSVFVSGNPLALWDMVAAGAVYQAAKRLAIGTEIAIDR